MFRDLYIAICDIGKRLIQLLTDFALAVGITLEEDYADFSAAMDFVRDLDTGQNHNAKPLACENFQVKPNTLPLQNRKRVFHCRNCC
jgi:hypothetical protein